MQTETTAPAATTTTAPAGQVDQTTQTTTTPPASGQEGAAAGQVQPGADTTAAPANGQGSDQGTQQADAGQADGTATSEQDRDDTGRFKSKIQKRIDELTHARHAAERDAARWRAIAEASQKASPAPQAHEFATDADYEAALRRHEAREAARETAAEQASRAADEYQQEAAGAVDATYNERAIDAARRIPDFVQVVGGVDLNIPMQMLDALKASAHGPDMVYALAKDLGEAKRIAAMPPAQMFMALGAMEARIAATSPAASAPAATAAPAARTTSAPPPARTTGAASAPPNTDPANMSMDEYKAMRRAQGSRYIS